MPLEVQTGTKVMSASDAVQLVEDGACITISGTVGRMQPLKVLNALEARFLTEGHPNGLTWFDPFPTGVPGIEPLSHPGLLKRVIGGWFTPHPRLRDMITANEIEAYLYPLGSLSFWCQAMAAGRDHYLTQVGLETYLDPRNGGGRLNDVTTEELVTLVELHGKEYIEYSQLPISCAIIRGTVADEEGNLSIRDEHTTMNVLYQALAAKRFGGRVIVQAKQIVPAGTIPARHVTIPGVLVDAIVVEPDQREDEAILDMDWLSPTDRTEVPPGNVLATPASEAWRRWLHERVIDPTLVPPVRHLSPDTLIARRAAMEMQRGAVVNIGQGLPMRNILPVTLEEGIQQECWFSVETGAHGGVVNGVGFRSNTTSILDTPATFSVYGSGLISAAFFSMIEFDRAGNVNLLRYGDTWVGPGGSMDIAQAAEHIVFCGTFRAVGFEAEGKGGRLHIHEEGAAPRAVSEVQGICFNGPKMAREGKHALYVTERAVFQLREDGIELIEIAPGIDLQRDVLDKLDFRPAVSPNLREMDTRIFTEQPMGLLNDWNSPTRHREPSPIRSAVPS